MLDPTVTHTAPLPQLAEGFVQSIPQKGGRDWVMTQRPLPAQSPSSAQFPPIGDGVDVELELVFEIAFAQARATPPLAAVALTQVPVQLESDTQESAQIRLPSPATQTAPAAH